MTDATLPAPDAGERIEVDVDAAVLAEAATAVDGAAEAVDMTPLDTPRRLLLVHAHPDDETIGTGATMAKYAAERVLVTLVTCTLGEEGEVLVPELAHLASDVSDGAAIPRSICEMNVRCRPALSASSSWDQPLSWRSLRTRSASLPSISIPGDGPSCSPLSYSLLVSFSLIRAAFDG